MELSSEELYEWAIRFIGTVDYDIEKECQYNLDEEGEDDLVDEMISQIGNFIQFLKIKGE